MSMHYYAIREIDGDKTSPVQIIMTTEGYTFVSPGVYRAGDDMTPSHLSRIEKWEYDMLDAFGVRVITPDEFRRMMSNRIRRESDYCR